MDFQHTGSLRRTSPAGTVISSSTRPQRDGVWTPACVGPAAPGQMLLQEALWQLERRALQVQEEEFRYCMSRGILGHHHPRAFPSVIALIPPAEYHQLERLCGRVPPSQNAIVLSRIYDLLAHNDIPPWELVNVFKQVLQDFLRRQDECAISSASMTFLPILEKAPKSRAQKPLVDEFGKCREEIPTISSYVDRHWCAGCPYAFLREWRLPFCPHFTYEAYSTTL